MRIVSRSNLTKRVNHVRSYWCWCERSQGFGLTIRPITTPPSSLRDLSGNQEPAHRTAVNCRTDGNWPNPTRSPETDSTPNAQ